MGKSQLLYGLPGIGRLTWIGTLALSLAACTQGFQPTLAPTIAAPQINVEVNLKQAAPFLVSVDTPEPEVTQTSTSVIDPAMQPPTIWSEPPVCQNEPLNSEGWQSLLANQQGETRAAFANQAALVQGLVGADPGQAELAVLEMNVASGRLNRATRIDLPGLPDVQTVGDLMRELETGMSAESILPELIEASQQIQAGKGIEQPVCGRLLFTQYNWALGETIWTAQGILAGPQMAQVTGAGEPDPIKDTGITSPDGKLAAFTSLQGEAGGPVFLLDLQSGAWTNLIETINMRLKGSQPTLLEDLWWEIAGWLPDSQSLMLSPADLSVAFLVNLNDFSYRVYGFEGGGLGGSRLVQLSPDGTRFVFVGIDASGGQSLNSVDLATGSTTVLGILPSQDGFILYPRFSPDGGQLAYLVQSGHPTTGLTYSINLYTFDGASERVLIEGNLGQSVPVWSPDGQYIAFTRKESDAPDIVIPDQIPEPMRGNIWVIAVKDGSSQQMTFIDGWARSPAWDYDARTLAFVTHDGQVGMVNIAEPGRIWRAAETSSEYPLLTSTFFVP